MGSIAAKALRHLGGCRVALVCAVLVIVAHAILGQVPLWLTVVSLLATLLLAALLGDQGPRAGAASASEGGSASDARVVGRLVEALPDPATVLDSQGRIIAASRSAVGLFPGLQIGRDVALGLRDPDFVAALETARETGEAQMADIALRTPVRRNLAAFVAPVEPDTSAKTSPAVIIVFRDLSEEDRLTRMRTDFIANASHELRTPLASLRGFIETLQGPARDDPAARERFLEIMNQQAVRMSRLIDDLLSLSRVEMRAHLPPSDVVSVRGVLEHVAQSLEAMAGAAKISVVLDLPEGPLSVTGDRDELVQVFQNLMQNAVKYGRPGGSVRVTAERAPQQSAARDMLVISVIDDGPGIPPEHVPRLTERFYRVDAKHSRERGGTGLGLAIVKHIVARHRGELRIESTFGKGSTFTVTLPLVS